MFCLRFKRASLKRAHHVKDYIKLSIMKKTQAQICEENNKKRNPTLGARNELRRPRRRPNRPQHLPGHSGAQTKGLYIIDHMLQDERRHHAVLQRLSNLIDRDTSAYDEYLDLLQKYMVSPP